MPDNASLFNLFGLAHFIFRSKAFAALLAVAALDAFAAEPGRAAPQMAASEHAVPGQSVTATLVQSKVVKGPDGSEKLEDASSVKPGDILEYRVTYKNTSTKPVAGLVAHLPIPDGLVYQARSASSAAGVATVATAHGNFSNEPLVHRLNGNEVPVPYGEYRRIRWTLGQLPPKATFAVTARAQVESVIPDLVRHPPVSASPPARSTPTPH